MATTLPLAIFVLATTGLSIITLIGFLFSDWHAERRAYGEYLGDASQTEKDEAKLHSGRIARIGDAQNEALKAA